MPYILVIMFIIAKSGVPSPIIDHIDSIRFDDEKACKAAELWVRGRMEGYNYGPTPTSIRLECMPARGE